MSFFGFCSISEFLMFFTSILVGLTMVMGINAINSAPDLMVSYYKYIGNETPTRTKFWDNLLTIYTVITLVTQTLHELTNLTTFMCRFSLLIRLEVSSLIMLVELLVILLMVFVGCSEVRAIVALVVVAYLGGAARAYFENTAYALFGPCPPKMMSGVLIGASFSGVLLSILQIILKISMPNTYDAILTQFILYFTLAMGIIFASSVLLVILLYNPYAKQYVAEFRSHRSILKNIYRPLNRCHDYGQDIRLQEPLSQPDHRGGCEKDVVPCIKGENRGDLLHHAGQCDNVGGMEHGAANIADFPTAYDNSIQIEDVLFDDDMLAQPSREGCRAEPLQSFRILSSVTQNLDSFIFSSGVSPIRSHEKEVKKPGIIIESEKHIITTSELLQGVQIAHIIKVIYPMMIACFLTFCITYLMYPGILVTIDSSDTWYPTLIMTIYNFGDFVGRTASMWKLLWIPRRAVLITSIARIVFIPLMLLCAYKKITGKAFAYVLTALLAVSNGFIGTLSMVYATELDQLKGSGELAMAGQILGVCLLLGCSVGSLVQLGEVIPFS